MSQQEVELTRDVVATLIPHGEEFTLGRGEKVTITHRLGGNFTVMTLQGMYRIAARDADALGENLEEATKLPNDGNAQPAGLDEIKENLKSVFDPEIPVSLLSLGLVYGVSIDQEAGRVDIQMTLTAPGCGMGPVLVGDVEYRVAIVPNVKTVNVELVFDPPWSKEMMSEEAQLETGMFF